MPKLLKVAGADVGAGVRCAGVVDVKQPIVGALTIVATHKEARVRCTEVPVIALFSSTETSALHR